MKTNEIWELSTSYDKKEVTVNSGGMTVFTVKKDGTSVGYSANDRLERMRLISASPEMWNLLSMVKRLVNSNEIEDWQIKDFNNSFEKVEAKINGIGKLNAPNYCRASYEWTEEHIENYHNKVEGLKYKL